MKVQEYLFSLTNWSTPIGSSRGPMETPMNSVCPIYFAYRPSSSGISARQGGHHVPQKLTSTGLPRSADSLRGLLVFTSFNVKSGAREVVLGASLTGWLPTLTADIPPTPGELPS